MLTSKSLLPIISKREKKQVPSPWIVSIEVHRHIQNKTSKQMVGPFLSFSIVYWIFCRPKQAWPATFHHTLSTTSTSTLPSSFKSRRTEQDFLFYCSLLLATALICVSFQHLPSIQTTHTGGGVVQVQWQYETSRHLLGNPLRWDLREDRAPLLAPGKDKEDHEKIW